MLSGEQIADFERQGFVIAQELLADGTVTHICDQVRALFESQARKAGEDTKKDEALESLVYKVMKPNTPERKAAYELVRHVPAVRLAQNDPRILEVLRDLGFGLPMSMQIPTVRFDIPHEFEKRYMTLLHQDLRSIRSERCVTVWVPLTRIDAENGTVICYAGSQDLGLLDHEICEGQIVVKDPGVVDNYQAVTIEADPGDVVFLNSFCVHKSYREGLAGHVKINAQFMHNDGLAYNTGDEFAELASKIPMYGDIYKY